MFSRVKSKVASRGPSILNALHPVRLIVSVAYKLSDAVLL